MLIFLRRHSAGVFHALVTPSDRQLVKAGKSEQHKQLSESDKEKECQG